MQGWLVSYKHPDPERMFSRAYLREAIAYKDASLSIKDWAKYELENLEGDLERKYEIETLHTILELIERGEHKAAYEEWRSYADDMQPSEDVMIEDTDVVE